MTFVVLAILAIVWILVLGSYARERMADHHRDSVSSFRTQLTTLQRTQVAGSGSLGRASSRRGSSTAGVIALRCDAARQRRKNVLLALLTLALFGTVGVIVAASIVTVIFAVVSVGALVAYVALLVDRQRVLAEQRAKVHPIGTVQLSHTRQSTIRPVAAVGSSRR